MIEKEIHTPSQGVVEMVMEGIICSEACVSHCTVLLSKKIFVAVTVYQYKKCVKTFFTLLHKFSKIMKKCKKILPCRIYIQYI